MLLAIRSLVETPAVIAAPSVSPVGGYAGASVAQFYKKAPLNKTKKKQKKPEAVSLVSPVLTTRNDDDEVALLWLLN